MDSQPKRPFYKRWWFWTPVALVVVLMVARIVADPIAAHFTRKALHSLDGYDGSFNDVHVDFLALSYTITDIKLVETASKQKEPLFFAKKVISKLLWKDLLRFRIGATTRVEDSKSVLLAGTRTAEKAKAAGKEVEKAAKRSPAGLDVVDDTLKKIIPLRVVRTEVLRSEVVFIDDSVEPNARIWISEIEATVENVATRERLTGGQSAIVAMHGKLQKSGELTFFLSADPLAEKLNFAGRMELRHLQLADMYSFFAGYAGLSAPRGTYDMFLEFMVKDDHLSGGVKPMLKNVDLEPATANIGNILKEKVASIGYRLFSRKSEDTGERQLATSVPIDGVITGPEAQIYTAVLGILRNAFVVGLAEGFTHLPPPVAGKEQGPIKRATEALSQKGGVKTQPKKDK